MLLFSCLILLIPIRFSNCGLSPLKPEEALESVFHFSILLDMNLMYIPDNIFAHKTKKAILKKHPDV